MQSLRRFLTGHRAIAGDTARRAVLQEAFVAHIPFWACWATVLGWVFGQKKVGGGDNTRYEPREVKSSQEMVWNGAACDVGEFGVSTVPLAGRPLEPFNPDALHQQGMVFEPVGSISDASTAAHNEFNERVRKASRLDKISQVFVRFARRQMGAVYYPLWVLRYLYKGRAFQVAVDGFSGEVLYGKAPGSTLYRAIVLVAGMAAGAMIAVDVSALAFYIASQTKGDAAGALFGGGILALVLGFGLMATAYRAFRYGEQYEYRSGKSIIPKELLQVKNFASDLSKIEDITKWIGR
jgi:hypothetical protein